MAGFRDHLFFLRQGYTVSAGNLGAEEGAVRFPDQFGSAGSILESCGHADGNGLPHAVRRLHTVIVFQVVQEKENILPFHETAEEDGEFIASDPVDLRTFRQAAFKIFSGEITLPNDFDILVWSIVIALSIFRLYDAIGRFIYSWLTNRRDKK